MTSTAGEKRITSSTTSGEQGSATRQRMSATLGSAAITGALALFAASCGDTPAADSAPSSMRGAALYASNCASCHGDDLRGTDRGPSQLSIVYEPSHHPDDSYRSAIENGVGQHHWGFGNMPPIAGLDDTDVDEIIAFIRGEQQRQGFEPYERP